MADFNQKPTAEGSARMRRVRRADTGPELKVRAILHRLGYRYRIHVREMPGTPDIVFTRRKKALFIHGCFWHRHVGCARASTPQRNSSFWTSKFRANVERDRKKEGELRAGGWSVLVIWECETLHELELGQKLEQFLGPPRAR